MTVTRAQIRIEAARRLANGGLASAATGGSNLVLVDENRLKDSGASNDRYVGSYVLLTSGANAGQVRRVITYVASSGTLTFGNALPAAVTSGDSYELYDHLSPLEWNDCINRGLRRLSRERWEPVAIVANQRQYNLSTLFPWLEHEDRFLGLYLRRGPSGQKTMRELAPVQYFLTRESDGIVLNLRLALQPMPSDNLELVVRAIGPYEELTSDSATTACPLDWAVAATLVSAWELYGRSLDASDMKLVNTDRDLAQRELTMLTRRYAPPVARPVRTLFGI